MRVIFAKILARLAHIVPDTVRSDHKHETQYRQNNFYIDSLRILYTGHTRKSKQEIHISSESINPNCAKQSSQATSMVQTPSISASVVCTLHWWMSLTLMYVLCCLHNGFGFWWLCGVTCLWISGGAMILWQPFWRNLWHAFAIERKKIYWLHFTVDRLAMSLVVCRILLEWSNNFTKT